VWTAADVIALGVRTDVPTAGEILAGLCADESYRAVKRGNFPVPVLKVGRRLVVPVAPILELLGINPDTNVDGLAPPGPPTEHRKTNHDPEPSHEGEMTDAGNGSKSPA
jgi:hypothetical protein